jgi:hypothetical protein
MATSGYINGRKKYGQKEGIITRGRPQAILWSDNPGTLVNGLYVPTGQEIGADSTLTAGGINQFLILSDHNRQEMSFEQERIEKRQRTINGRMRSYHVADKLTFSTSWNDLPSRSHNFSPEFDATGTKSSRQVVVTPTLSVPIEEYTVDGGAGGVELLDWYENHKGSFWMFLSYDKHNNFSATDVDPEAEYKHLTQYNQVIEVYFSNFNYSVVKRGASNHDLWNISVSLEEV